jgi:glycosyltransferase involved in cell wall biosynthesis
MNKKFSVVIPCKNEEERIEECLRSVIAGCASLNAEIIVVDSYSTDSTVEKALRFPVEVLRLGPDWPHSPAAGRYSGALRAKGEFIFFIDADMTLEPAFLQKAVYLLNEDRSLAGVAGIGREIYLDGNGAQTGENTDLYHRAGPARRVDFLGGAALYRRSYLLEAGNFNPFMMGAEEQELSQRLRVKRYRLISIPEPMICHYTRTISDWEEFTRKKSASFYRGIGQGLRCSHAPRFLIENLRYYRQFAAFLGWLALGVVFPEIAIMALLAILLFFSWKKRSVTAARQSLLKWLIMCIEIVKGIFTPVPPATKYPSNPDCLTAKKQVSRFPRTIICISPIDWDFLRQRHQILMSHFADTGIKIIYIENMHPIPHLSFASVGRAFIRLFRITAQLKPGRTEDAITVITPLVVPSHGRVAVFFNKKIFNAILARRIRSLKAERPYLVWTYCATSTVLDLITRLAPDNVLYDCVYDAELHPDSPRDIAESERELLKRSTIVLTDNNYHLQKFKPLNPRIYVVGPGVDEIMFPFTPSPVAAPVPDVRNRGKRLCCFGGLSDLCKDFDLIRDVALRRPEWDIVLYGPVVKSDISRLRLPNIIFAGVVERIELASRLQEMDVLIMPYRLTEFSASVFPAKTFECLASGKPVVATPLPELKKFAPYIALASTAEQFVRMIEEALAHDTPQLQKQRIALARQNSWDARFSRVQEILQEKLR